MVILKGVVMSVGVLLYFKIIFLSEVIWIEKIGKGSGIRRALR